MDKSQTVRTVLITSSFWVSAILVGVLCIYVQRTAFAQGMTKGLETARADFATAQAATK